MIHELSFSEAPLIPSDTLTFMACERNCKQFHFQVCSYQNQIGRSGYFHMNKIILKCLSNFNRFCLLIQYYGMDIYIAGRLILESIFLPDFMEKDLEVYLSYSTTNLQKRAVSFTAEKNIPCKISDEHCIFNINLLNF